MHKSVFLGSMLVVASIAVGGYVASQRQVKTGRVNQRKVTDEDHGALRAKPVSDAALASLGSIGLAPGALLAVADPDAATDMGVSEWENTATVIVKKSPSSMVTLGGKKTTINLGAFGGVPVGVVSTGQTVVGGDDHGSEIRIRRLDGTGPLQQIPLPLTKPSALRITRPGERPGRTQLPETMVQLGTDNHVLKLKDGSLLAVRNVTSWEPVPAKPAWWSKVSIQGSPNGARVGTMVWHSTDGEKWVRRSFVDPINYESGRYAIPRPAPQEAGCPSGCFGGWDRVEAYACPFTGDVYLNMFAAGGFLIDYNTGKTKEASAFNNILFKSIDGGKTFKEITTFFGWTPVTMTTTPDGRLWLFSVNGVGNPAVGVPTVMYTTENMGLSVKLSDSYPVGLKNVAQGATPLYSALVYKETNCVSRVSTDASTSEVRVAYHFVDSKGKTAVAVAHVAANQTGAPTVKPVGVVRGGGDREVLACAFLDGDAEGVKVAPGTAALYWVEGSGTTNANGDFLGDGSMVVKAQIFRGPKERSTAVTVSKETSPTRSIGHYIGGGSFVNAGKIFFAPQWSDGTKTWMNVVSISE